MRTLTENELREILYKHELWLNETEGGEIANLREADLYGADLYGADLRGANLREADLRGANLWGARLYRANLYGADLYGADLSGANLRIADLSGANLREANLRGADLREADLSGADLYGADLYGADLSGADLSETFNLNIPYVCPIEGSFIGFKKALSSSHIEVIVELLILEDAKRSSATTNKCRCSKAKVLQIQDLEGNNLDVVACSKFDNAFKYKVGEIVEVSDFNEDRFVECGAGIHFFINRQDAVKYI